MAYEVVIALGSLWDGISEWLGSRKGPKMAVVIRYKPRRGGAAWFGCPPTVHPVIVLKYIVKKGVFFVFQIGLTSFILF